MEWFSTRHKARTANHFPDHKTLMVNMAGGAVNRVARWFPAAQSHFLPWHIDNLYLEVLVERGLPGLLVFLAVVAWAMGLLVRGPGRLLPLTAFGITLNQLLSRKQGV